MLVQSDSFRLLVPFCRGSFLPVRCRGRSQQIVASLQVCWCKVQHLCIQLASQLAECRKSRHVVCYMHTQA